MDGAGRNNLKSHGGSSKECPLCLETDTDYIQMRGGWCWFQEKLILFFFLLKKEKENDRNKDAVFVSREGMNVTVLFDHFKICVR